MTVPGQPFPFTALQFHVHAGSDHALDGTLFGADMHLVHKEGGNGTRLAVLGFFIEPSLDSSTPKFGDLLNHWDAVATNTSDKCSASNSNTTVSTNTTLQSIFNPYNLVPKGSTIYTYNGSLTTPPCSEIVFWNVLDKPVQLSIREYLRMTNLILDYVDPKACQAASVAATSGYTGRPLQPLNGRKITRHCPTGFVDLVAMSKHSSATVATDIFGAAVSMIAASAFL
jgi:carbonic anhydrase